MNKGQIDYAEERAKHFYHEWNDITGVFHPGESYFHEIESCIIDAVHIGIQMALYGDIRLDDDGQIVHERREVSHE
jgi:hypothetical protein